MGLFRRFKKTKETETLKTHNLGGCIITRSLYERSSKLKWMFRENPVNDADNGWRALGDTDTEEYINIPENNIVVDFDRLVEMEPAVLAVYSLPVGTDLVFDPQRRTFVDSNTGAEYR
uniref:Immunity protein Imm33 domain-containing protein n=1 Tax=Eubacterium cellulosolvens (strain ATCC 43171 / JCM 9499 / 6) TaxID=633697 RepID=I5AXN5_EUBC6